MYTSEHIEERIWEYIDGICPPEEVSRIEHLIATDEVWKNIHKELLTMHYDMGAVLSPSEPAANLTAKVMSQVHTPTHTATQPLNPLVVRGIAAVFLLCIATAITAALTYSENSTVVYKYQIPSYSLPDINMHWLATPGITLGAVAIVALLAILFLDAAIRTKRALT